MRIIPYRHPKFQPGITVHIDASIKEEYPRSPLADQTVRVTSEWISLSTLFYILFCSQQQVPVVFKKQTWFVNEEYIRPLYAISKRAR